VKVESAEIKDEEFVSKVVDSVSLFAKDAQSIASISYLVTELRINLKENRVFVVWEDYSEEEKRIEELINEYMSVKTQIKDPITQPTLMMELINIANEFKKLTGMNIEEVVG